MKHSKCSVKNFEMVRVVSSCGLQSRAARTSIAGKTNTPDCFEYRNTKDAGEILSIFSHCSFRFLLAAVEKDVEGSTSFACAKKPLVTLKFSRSNCTTLRRSAPIWDSALP